MHDPVDAVHQFGYSRPGWLSGPTLIQEPWHNLFERCGAGRYRKTGSPDGTQQYEGFRVRKTSAQEVPGGRDCLIYLEADRGWSEQDLSRVGPALAAALGVASVEVAPRDGRSIVLVATNRTPETYPSRRVHREPQIGAPIPLTFSGSDRVVTIAYQED